MYRILSDILPQLKHVGFLLLLRFRLHSSRSGRFCRNPFPSFKVIPVLNVASLGISVFPLHASLSACNRDMPLFHSSVQTVAWWHSQPHGEVLSEQSFHGDFQARLPPRVVSCLHIYGIVAYNSFTFIQRLKSLAFCSGDRKSQSNAFRQVLTSWSMSYGILLIVREPLRIRFSHKM